MPSFTVRIGVLLIVFGAATYVTSGAVSVTALIPSLVGTLLVACGLVAARHAVVRPHAMHAAALIALAGVLGTAGALLRVPALLSEGALSGRPAIVARASMAIILIVYLGFSVRSFVAARFRRQA